MTRGRQRIDYPPVLTPSELDIAFAAGFYEGEGYFGLNISDDEMAKISQNDREILDWLVLRFGGVIYGPKVNEVGNLCYEWVVVRDRAINFMTAILHYLSKSRQEQFNQAMQGLGSKREYEQSVTNEGISPAFLDKKLEQHFKKKKNPKRDAMKLFGIKE